LDHPAIFVGGSQESGEITVTGITLVSHRASFTKLRFPPTVKQPAADEEHHSSHRPNPRVHLRRTAGFDSAHHEWVRNLRKGAETCCFNFFSGGSVRSSPTAIGDRKESSEGRWSTSPGYALPGYL